MMTHGKKWDVQKICLLFNHDVANEILKVPLLEEVSEDCMVWKKEQNENCSVKTTYKLVRSSQSNHINHMVEGDWSSLWNIKAPPRAK